MGEMIEFASNGHTCPGYLAVPERGHGPGVVVIQEYWGLVDHIISVCDRLAAEGYTALAPDLFHGEKAKEPDEAGKKMMALKLDVAAVDMGAAAQWLVQSEQASGAVLGALGFCMGGGLALILASQQPEIRATAAYYGVIPWEEASPDLTRIRGEVVGHWGTRDESNPPERVEQLQKRLQDAGVQTEFFWYEGAQHAFFNDDRPEVYDQAAAQLSWERTLAVFRRQLMAP